MRKFQLILLLIGTLCMLGGCRAARGVRSEVPAWRAERWLAPPDEAVPDTPIIEGEAEINDIWSEHKGPWEIVDLVEIALQNNPLTMETWENAKSAAYSWKSTMSTLYPSLLLNEEILINKFEGTRGFGAAAFSASQGTGIAGGTGTNNTTATTISSTPNYNKWLISTLSFSYLMLDFGGRLANIEAARQALFVANWTHNRNLQTVILNTMTDAYNYLQAKALYEARLDDLNNAQKNYDAANGQFQAGVARKLDVLLAQSNLANAKLILEQQGGVVHTTMGQLAASIGLPASAVFDVHGLPENIKYGKVIDDMDKLIATAKIERPDLAAAEAYWKEEHENAVVVWSSGMPTLTANGFAEDVHNIHHKSLSSREYSGSIMLNVPLFNGFYYVNSTRAAMATADSAYAAWKQEENQVILDVVTSYYNFETAVETVKSSEEFYTYTLEAYDVAFASYRSGVGTILDLLAAQSSLSDARAQRIQARTQWITALANVSYATGLL